MLINYFRMCILMKLKSYKIKWSNFKILSNIRWTIWKIKRKFIFKSWLNIKWGIMVTLVKIYNLSLVKMDLFQILKNQLEKNLWNRLRGRIKNHQRKVDFFICKNETSYFKDYLFKIYLRAPINLFFSKSYIGSVSFNI